MWRSQLYRADTGVITHCVVPELLKNAGGDSMAPQDEPHDVTFQA